MLPGFREWEEGEEEKIAPPIQKESNGTEGPVGYMGKSPSEFGVPHSSWRPSQLHALDFISKNLNQPTLVELPVGVGKSSIATAMGQNENVLVLVQSHALLDQYEQEYGFSVVKGMQSYDCVLPKKVEEFQGKHGRKPTAAECHYERMSDCPVYDKCPYILARNKALAAKRMACTYPFAMLSNLVQQRSGYSIWDEAHMSAEIILNLSEMRISERWRQKFQLPPLPLYGFSEYLDSVGRRVVTNWITAAIKMTDSVPSGMHFEEESEWRSANTKLRYFLQHLTDQSMEFFFECGDIEDEHFSHRGSTSKRKLPAMSLRPLSASMLSGKLSAGKRATVLMSATIGDPGPLASELGFKGYNFQTFPHPIPAKYRPVYDMKLQRMTWDNLSRMPLIYHIQAMQIAAMIESFPAEWRGIVLTASYDKARRIKEALDGTNLGKRVFVPPAGREGLGDRIGAFLDDPRGGLIVVDIMHGWGHGLNLVGDLARYAIVAGVPFGNQQDKFESVRRQMSVSSANYAWWMSYTNVPQACGRVSRGEIGEDGLPMLNVAALADGSATSERAMKYYPPWFRESIVPWRS